jgi:hypothetical protein
VLKGCARSPGLHGTCEIEEIEIAIEPPCCCPPLAIGQVGDVREQPEDEEERGEGKKKSGKKKRKSRD